jgi:hypothetical protein
VQLQLFISRGITNSRRQHKRVRIDSQRREELSRMGQFFSKKEDIRENETVDEEDRPWVQAIQCLDWKKGRSPGNCESTRA